jgi:hypothetical protein
MEKWGRFSRTVQKCVAALNVIDGLHRFAWGLNNFGQAGGEDITVNRRVGIVPIPAAEGMVRGPILSVSVLDLDNAGNGGGGIHATPPRASWYHFFPSHSGIGVWGGATYEVLRSLFNPSGAIRAQYVLPCICAQVCAACLSDPAFIASPTLCAATAMALALHGQVAVDVGAGYLHSYATMCYPPGKGPSPSPSVSHSSTPTLPPTSTGGLH